jgi:hypothetical protein
MGRIEAGRKAKPWRAALVFTASQPFIIIRSNFTESRKHLAMGIDMGRVAATGLLGCQSANEPPRVGHRSV